MHFARDFTVEPTPKLIHLFKTYHCFYKSQICIVKYILLHNLNYYIIMSPTVFFVSRNFVIYVTDIYFPMSPVY